VIGGRNPRILGRAATYAAVLEAKSDVDYLRPKSSIREMLKLRPPYHEPWGVSPIKSEVY
jgi:hypothetical protein